MNEEIGSLLFQPLSNLAQQLPVLAKHFNNTPVLNALIDNGDGMRRLLALKRKNSGSEWRDSDKGIELQIIL
jgi:hypothetical protein